MSDVQVPLLQEDDEATQSSSQNDKQSPPLSWTTVTALIVIVACANTATRVVDLPLTRLIESRYCSRYYLEHDPTVIADDGTIPEELCKVDVVQQQLAWLLGCIVTMHVLFGERSAHHLPTNPADHTRYDRHASTRIPIRHPRSEISVHPQPIRSSSHGRDLPRCRLLQSPN